VAVLLDLFGLEEQMPTTLFKLEFTKKRENLDRKLFFWTVR